MFILACTGGIGSGKTYISSIFQKMGIPVYYSDDRAKDLYHSSIKLKEQVIDLFGSEVYTNGQIRRDILAKRVFADSDLLNKLELIIHPAVIDDFKLWLLIQKNKYNFVIFESAIILDKPLFKDFADKILVVTAPLELRINRVIARDQVTKEDILKRINMQSSDKKREEYADFIIFADEIQALLPQVFSVIAQMNMWIAEIKRD